MAQLINNQSDNTDVGTQSVPGAATIVFGEVTITEDAKYIPEKQTGSVFSDYMIINRYERDNHIYMMGIASPSGFQGNTAAFVQLASPTMLWICDWTAAKLGSIPSVPDQNVSDPRWVLLDVLPELSQVVVAPDGKTPLYRISGTYVYGCLKPSTNAFDDVVFPRPPWLDDFTTRTVPQSTFQKNLSEKQGRSSQGFFVTR